MSHSKSNGLSAMVAGLALFALALAGAYALLTQSGCHNCEPYQVVLPERIGTPVAEAITKAFGQEPKAVSVPCGPTFYFEEMLANDTCLWAHEQKHREQEDELGAAEFTAEYVREYLDCRHHGADSETCLKTIPLEKAAYDVQHACQGVQ